MGCGVIGPVFVLLELCSIKITESSLPGLEKKGLCLWSREVLAWITAAGITGIIGTSLAVLQPTIEGCVGAAASWQALTRIFMGREGAPSGSDSDDEGGEEGDSVNCGLGLLHQMVI